MITYFEPKSLLIDYMVVAIHILGCFSSQIYMYDCY